MNACLFSKKRLNCKMIYAYTVNNPILKVIYEKLNDKEGKTASIYFLNLKPKEDTQSLLIHDFDVERFGKSGIIQFLERFLPTDISLYVFDELAVGFDLFDQTKVKISFT